MKIDLTNINDESIKNKVGRSFYFKYKKMYKISFFCLFINKIINYF